MTAEGTKKDAGKARWDLLPWREVREVVEVLTAPVVSGKYSEENWKKVPDAAARYFAAAQRHQAEWWVDGKTKDPDDGKHPIAHAIASLLFILWFEMEKEKHERSQEVDR